MKFWKVTHWRIRNGLGRYIPTRRDLLRTALINHRCRAAGKMGSGRLRVS